MKKIIFGLIVFLFFSSFSFAEENQPSWYLINSNKEAKFKFFNDSENWDYLLTEDNKKVSLERSYDKEMIRIIITKDKTVILDSKNEIFKWSEDDKRVVKDIYFSLDKKNIAFLIKSYEGEDKKYIVHYKWNESKYYDDINNFTFSPDSKKISFIARKNWKEILVENLKEVKPTLIEPKSEDLKVFFEKSIKDFDYKIDKFIYDKNSNLVIFAYWDARLPFIIEGWDVTIRLQEWFNEKYKEYFEWEKQDFKDFSLIKDWYIYYSDDKKHSFIRYEIEKWKKWIIIDKIYFSTNNYERLSFIWYREELNWFLAFWNRDSKEIVFINLDEYEVIENLNDIKYNYINKEELTKELILLKNNLKDRKWNKYVEKFEELIPKISAEKLFSINEKLEKFDLSDIKYEKYKDILTYLKLKIKLELYDEN